MQRALSGLLATQPFFGIAAMHITPPTRRQDITSIASDGLQLYYNPRWVIEASGNEIFHAVAHCVTACALKHHVRRGDRTSRRWQTASRQVTQHILLAHGLANPEARPRPRPVGHTGIQRPPAGPAAPAVAAENPAAGKGR